VYDFGGGTFDAAVVRVNDGGAQVIGVPEGLARLGGIDFDLAVLSHVDDAIGGAAGNLDADAPEARTALARLRDDCRQAREALSSDTEAEIPVLLPTVRTSVRLTRSELEALASPRLADTGAVMDRVVAGAGLTYDQLAGILLVGGTSRMPLVADFVRGHTGKVPASDVDPLLAIASGAALLAEAGTQGVAIAAVPEAVPDGGSDPISDDTVLLDVPPPPPPFVATPAEPPAPGEPRGPRQKARLAVIGLVLLALATAAALTLLGGGDEDQARIGSTGDTTTTVEATTTSELDTTTTTGETSDTSDSPPASGGGGTGGTAPTTPVTVRPTTPFFEALNAPSSVSCAGKASNDRVEVVVSWKAGNAESVTVAIDQPGQIWESGLPTQGSTMYTVICDGSQTSTTAIVTAKGLGDTGKTESVTIPIAF
jgi:hypothetical protein